METTGGRGWSTGKNSIPPRLSESSSPVYDKLDQHDVFERMRVHVPSVFYADNSGSWRPPRISVNLIANDSLGRLFVWDSERKQLHYVDVQGSDGLHSFGSSEAGTLLAKREFQTVQLSSPVDFQVLHLAFNRTGRWLALVGDTDLMVLNPLAPGFAAASGLCRVQKVGERIYNTRDGLWLRILQVGWHPHSDTHLGMLSSDGCFRLFDLSLNAESAEQEYYIQPRTLGRSGSPSLSRPIFFAYGGEHLWDLFTVFILYNGGSVFVLCPIVPFSSLYNRLMINELAKDAKQLESLKDNPPAIAESAILALAWLEAVFPDLASSTDTTSQKLSGRSPVFKAHTSSVFKAHAHVPLDASLLLQGPFLILCRGAEGGERDLEEPSVVAGQAVGLLCNVVGKDSVIAVSTKEGQVYVYVLTDEVHPAWDLGKPPHLTMDDKGHILAVGMLVESNDTDVLPAFQHSGKAKDGNGTFRSGKVPPLLQVAVVDLALQPETVKASPLVLFKDPVVPERLYCQHAAGIDVVLVQWLPFSGQNTTSVPSKDQSVRVFPVLDMYPTPSTVPQPLLGVAVVLDSLGESWIVGVTANCDGVVINMKPHRTMPEPLVIGWKSEEELDSGKVEVGIFQMMSRELLQGPKDILLTQMTSSGPRLTLDTIEGRTVLHDQCKLLREKYMEYAHRVYVELISHGSRLGSIVKEQKQLVKKVEARLKQAQTDSSFLAHRVHQAAMKNRDLEQSAKRCSTLPSVSGKPFTQAERKFKKQLDIMRLQDLDIINSAVEVLRVRSERLLGNQIESPQTSPSGMSDKVAIPDSQMRKVKQAVQHTDSSIVDSFSKVKLIDESLRHFELLKDR